MSRCLHVLFFLFVCFYCQERIWNVCMSRIVSVSEDSYSLASQWFFSLILCDTWLSKRLSVIWISASLFYLCSWAQSCLWGFNLLESGVCVITCKMGWQRAHNYSECGEVHKSRAQQCNLYLGNGSFQMRIVLLSQWSCFGCKDF